MKIETILEKFQISKLLENGKEGNFNTDLSPVCLLNLVPVGAKGRVGAFSQFLITALLPDNPDMAYGLLRDNRRDTTDEGFFSLSQFEVQSFMLTSIFPNHSQQPDVTLEVEQDYLPRVKYPLSVYREVMKDIGKVSGFCVEDNINPEIWNRVLIRKNLARVGL